MTAIPYHLPKASKSERLRRAVEELRQIPDDPERIEDIKRVVTAQVLISIVADELEEEDE